MSMYTGFCPFNGKEFDQTAFGKTLLEIHSSIEQHCINKDTVFIPLVVDGRLACLQEEDSHCPRLEEVEEDIFTTMFQQFFQELGLATDNLIVVLVGGTNLNGEKSKGKEGGIIPKLPVGRSSCLLQLICFNYLATKGTPPLVDNGNIGGGPEVRKMMLSYQRVPKEKAIQKFNHLCLKLMAERESTQKDSSSSSSS